MPQHTAAEKAKNKAAKKKGFLARLKSLLKPIGADDKKKRVQLGKNTEKLLEDVDA